MHILLIMYYVYCLLAFSSTKMLHKISSTKLLLLAFSSTKMRENQHLQERIGAFFLLCVCVCVCVCFLSKELMTYPVLSNDLERV